MKNNTNIVYACTHSPIHIIFQYCVIWCALICELYVSMMTREKVDKHWGNLHHGQYPFPVSF
jgi:hypothetical protein